MTVIIINSPERASSALLALEGAVQEAPKEPCASPENGVLDGGPPDTTRAVGEAPLEIAAEPSFSTKLVSVAPVG